MSTGGGHGCDAGSETDDVSDPERGLWGLAAGRSANPVAALPLRHAGPANFARARFILTALFPGEQRSGRTSPRVTAQIDCVLLAALVRGPRREWGSTMRSGVISSGFTGIALVFLSAALWATVGVAVELVPGAASLPPEALGLVRITLAGPLILLLIAVSPVGPAQFRRIGRLDPLHLAAFALACVAFQVGLFRAFSDLGVTITVVMTVCLPPVLSILWSNLRGAGLGPGGWLALSLSALGLCLFSAPQLAADTGADNLAGTVLAVVASVAFVFMSRSARVLAREVSPIMVAGLGLTLAGVLFCLVFPWLAAAPLPSMETIGQDWHLLGLILYLAVVPTALAYICYCSGIARCRSTDVGLIASMIEPAIAAVLAMFMLQERLTLTEISGCLLMTLAMGVLMQAERGTSPMSATA